VAEQRPVLRFAHVGSVRAPCELHVGSVRTEVLRPIPRMQRDREAAQRPEQRILAAADIPQPLAGRDPMHRDAGDHEMQEAQRSHEHGEDAENQPDREYRLDHAGDIHPKRRRLKLGRDEKAQRLGHEKLGVDVRDEERPADETHDVEAVERIESLIEPRHRRVPPFPRRFPRPPGSCAARRPAESTPIL
jgi:hypothetical protein